MGGFRLCEIAPRSQAIVSTAAWQIVDAWWLVNTHYPLVNIQKTIENGH